MISVIIPVYKVESYLPECIDSILRQTYRDLEILLIDDGSPDRCGEICDKYAGIDARIRVFHTENKGLSAARNLGLREAKGEYIGFVDSDDWIEPDMYEILLRRLKETGTDISACGVWNECPESKHVYSVCDKVFIGPEATRALVCNLTNAVWNKLYRKECWAGISFPEKHIYEDNATIYKVVLRTESLSCVPDPLYHYRMREGSTVHTNSMDYLIDYWVSIYDRYSYLRLRPEFKDDREFIEQMEKQIASAAVRVWKWIDRIPKEQRDYGFLHRVSEFMQNHYPLFGARNWYLSLRVGAFFTRYASEVSIFVLHIVMSFHRLYSGLRYRKKTLYPSI